jgi:hypothetical protein
MHRVFLASVLMATLALVPSAAASAQTAAGCQPGEAPHFTFGFAALKTQIGDDMGDALTCEFPDPNGTGDVHQRTTKGLAFWRKSTNTPTFTNGFDHWAETPNGWVTWTGASVDPPANAQPPATAVNPYPDIIVQGFMRGCLGDAPDDQKRNTCSCAINRIQASYSLTEFINISSDVLQSGTLPPEFVNIVVQCVLAELQ